MSDTIENPRKPLLDAVEYAVDQVKGIRRMLTSRGLRVSGLRYLELGPGTDLAPQLVLAGQGAEVTVADKFLTEWDRSYHPEFYRMFLEAFQEPCPAIEAVLIAGDHDTAIRCLSEPAEDLRSVPGNSVDFVLSNAVLEHVLDIEAAAAELRRVARLDGVQAHQVDFRDHRDYRDPLAHLLMPNTEYDTHFEASNGRHGTRLRMSEFVDIFARHFWIEELEVNSRVDPDYAAGILRGLPPESAYAAWPVASLVNVGGRLWLRPRDVESTWKTTARKLTTFFSSIVEKRRRGSPLPRRR